MCLENASLRLLNLSLLEGIILWFPIRKMQLI